MNLIPGLSLRATSEEEETGLDDAQLGEFAYDYVELSRHVNEFFGSEDHSSGRGSLKGVSGSEPLKTEQPEKTVEV